MRQLIPVGILIIFLGMILIFIGALTSIKEGKTDTKVAVGGFIGFIPFGMWNDKRLSWVIFGFMALVMAFLIFMQLRISNP